MMVKRMGISIVSFIVMVSLAGCSDTIESIPTTSVDDYSETVIADDSEFVDVTDVISEYSDSTDYMEDKLLIPSEYYDVIDSIVDYVVNFNPDVLDKYIGMTDTSGIAELSFHDDALDRIGFAFMDIDGDKNAELVILECIDEYSEYRVLEFYTYYDEAIHHVFSGWARNSFQMLDNMSFFNTSSAGAAYSCRICYVYNSERHDISFVDSYFTVSGSDLDNGSDDIYLCHTSDESLIFTVDEGVEVIGKLSDYYDEYDYRSEDLYEFEKVVKLSDYISEK